MSIRRDNLLRNQAAFLLKANSADIYLAADPTWENGDFYPGVLHCQGMVYEYLLDEKGIVAASLVNTGRKAVAVVVA